MRSTDITKAEECVVAAGAGEEKDDFDVLLNREMPYQNNSRIKLSYFAVEANFSLSVGIYAKRGRNVFEIEVKI